MAREVEVKIMLNAKESTTLKKWLKANAQFKKEVKHLEYYLDNPSQTFYFTHKLGFKDAAKYFRIRMEKEGASVCLKIFSIDQEKNESKNLDEVEFNVSDAAAALKLLKLLGFTDKTTVDKKRKVYDYKDFEIVQDCVKGLGEFAEFEYKGKKSTYKNELEKVFDLLKQIGFKKIRTQSRGYVSMLWNPRDDFTKPKILN